MISHEMLSQVEHQVLLTLVELSKEQNAAIQSQKIQEIFENVQNSLKTIEMIKRIKQSLDITVSWYKGPKR